MNIINGKEIADGIVADLKEEIEDKNLKPVLVIILVGEDEASSLYVRNKIKKAEGIGINCRINIVDSSETKSDIIQIISELNKDDRVDGIVLQLPLPSVFSVEDREELLELIDLKKDIDGFGLITNWKEEGKEKKNINISNYFQAPVSLAVKKVLDVGDLNWRSKKIVLVGMGRTGGTPIKSIINYQLSITNGENPNLEVVDEYTKDAKSIIKKADIVISSVGKSGLITKDMVKEGFFGVAVGLSKDDEGKWKSDFSSEAEAKASVLTPVPGGIGPLTVAYLLQNVVESNKSKSKS